MIFLAPPAPDLAARIELYCAIPPRAGAGRVFHELFPSAAAQLVLRLSPGGSRMVVIGPSTEKSTIELDQGAHYCVLSFRPGQLPRFVDLHPAGLVNGRLELDRLPGAGLDSLADQLHGLTAPQARQQLLETLARGCAPLVRSEVCRRAASVLEAHKGQLSVAALASGLGLHVRSLERLFREHLGLSPKRLARLIRVRHLLHRLRGAGFQSLAQLSFECGYADQSHMIKDLKALTGRVPGEIDPGFDGRVTGAPCTRIVHRWRP